MTERVKSECLGELFEYIKNGQLSPKQVIDKADIDFESGKINRELYSFIVKISMFFERVKYNGDKYVNLQELVDIGLYDSIDEILEFIDNNKDVFKGTLLSSKPCPFPEPTENEINQYVEGDMNKICIICCRRKRHTIILPCGHNILCSVCSKSLADKKENDKFCPVCRKEIDKIQRIYQ